MDFTILVRLLAPFLPFLLGLGQKALDKGAEGLGEKGAQEIWDKLFPKLKAKPAALEAAQDVAQKPDDEEALIVLKVQLEKILKDPENKALAAEITSILQSIVPTSENASKYAIDAKDSQIGIIGDGAKVYGINFGTKS